MKHTIIKRIISLLVASTVMFCLAGNAFANTTAKRFSVDSIVNQYGGDQSDELRSLINKYIIVYEDSASQQRFLGLVAQKLAAGTPANHIMMMNIRQVMAGFPEGSLPSGDTQTTRGSDGEIRANNGGVRPKIAVGHNHTVYLKHDGTVVTWGKYILDAESINDEDEEAAVNPTGQLMTIPISDVIDVAAGGGSALALKSDGTVWAWGVNTRGQLGDGTTTNQLTPVQVKQDGEYLANVTAIAIGPYNGAAIKSDGSVVTWGDGLSGQLGIGLQTTYYPKAIRVVDVGGDGYLDNITSIAIGQKHMLALKSDGTLVAWGDNTYGQLGNNSTDESHNAPVQVVDISGTGTLSNIKSIAVGHNHCLALGTNGTVWAWGVNREGELGIGTTYDHSNKPIQVLGPNGTGFLQDVISVTTGDNYCVAVKSDGTVWAWGVNTCGQLGIGTTSNYSATPVQVRGPGGTGYLQDVTSVTTDGTCCRALKSDGTVWKWGGKYGVSGQYPHQDAFLPPSVSLGDIIKISGNMLLLKNGTVWTKESNASEQLGTGDHANESSDPYLPVKGVDGVGILENIVDITSGLANVALAADGSVYAWGDNQYGTCGDNTTTNRSTPVRVSGLNNMGYLTGVSRVICGKTYFFAITSSGQLVGWGDNWQGQFGTGSNHNQYNYPVYVYNTGAIFADEYGDAMVTAEEIIPNRAINGNLYGSRDCDYFTFVFHGEIGAIINLTSELDKVSFSVYDSQQQHVSPGVGSGGRYYLTDNERYYIKLNQSYSPPSDYKLRIDFIENNLDNTFETARAIAPNKTIIDNLYSSDDRDYFSFSSGESIGAILSVTAQNGIIFSVFNDQQQVISVNSKGYYPLESNTQYYIRLSPSYSAVTNYTLNLRLFQDNAGSTLSSAQELYPNEHHQFQSSGSIDYIGDIDVFKFAVSKAGTYYLSTTGNCDTFGTLKRADGTTIVSANTGGEGSNFKITQDLETDSENPIYYYLEVKSNTQTTGEYTLYIEKPLEITDINAITITDTNVN